MLNQIRDVVVLNHRLDPHQTELYIYVLLEMITRTTEVKGRMTGPHCANLSTIEIAYPMREVERTDHVVLRVVIPEPCWWEPTTPFVYEGLLDLWQDGVFCEKRELSHGIRRLQLTSKGLRLNGEPFVLQGKIVEPTWTEHEARKQRRSGLNAVFTYLSEPSIDLWRLGDRRGFFVLGACQDAEILLQCRNALSGHASHFAWIFNRDQIANAPAQHEGLAMLYGVNTSVAARPDNADFIVCHEHELAWLGDAALPKIVIVKQMPTLVAARSDVIGWIESA